MKKFMSCRCTKKRYLPQRYLVALMCMMGIIVGYGQRVCLNMAITEMTVKNASQSTECPPRNSTFIKTKNYNITGGVINWSNQEQHYVIGSFYIGYFAGHIPAGLLCDRYGSRYVFFAGMCLSSVSTIVTPLIVTNAPAAVAIALRIIVGFVQAVIYPAISVLYARWVPLRERAFLGSFSLAANAFGVIFGNFLTGTAIQLSAHWPTGFYIWAIMGAVWCALFIFYVYSQPDTHPHITPEEKSMLDEEIVKGTRMKCPWKSILLSWPVWGLIIAETGHGFSLYTLMNSMPKYLHDILHYEISENALASSLPFTTQWFGAMICGKITDCLVRGKRVRVVIMRRITTTIGITIPGIFIVLAGYMRCESLAVIIMFSASMLFKGAVYSGAKVNHLELSINFAGILIALINGIGALSGWISPTMISFIAPNNTLDEWIIVFWVVFVIAFVSNVFYWVVATGKRQKWDMTQEEQDQLEREKAAKEEKAAQKAAAKAAAKEAKAAESEKK